MNGPSLKLDQKIGQGQGDCEPRELEYETDLLARLDWRGYDPTLTSQRIPENPIAAVSQLQRITLADHGDELLENKPVAASHEAATFDPSYVARVISDLVPNPSAARSIGADLLMALEARGFDYAKIDSATRTIVSLLREHLDKERLSRSEGQFKDDLSSGQIHFRLRIDGQNWRMPKTITPTEPEGADTLANKNGLPLERNFFTPVYKAEMNEDEQQVAVIALETKGEHLQNEDTDYKSALLQALTDGFAWDDPTPVNQLELTDTGKTVRCELILMKDIKANLPNLM